ncbi:MAG: DUF523 domain-containing protein [Desulfobacteraceae bacterium]
MPEEQDRVSKGVEGEGLTRERPCMLVSACLLGVRCRYDGRDSEAPALVGRVHDFMPLAVCPEQLGGLSTPRPPATIQGGDGRDVLEGNARLWNERGEDVTALFLKGAQETLRLARICRARVALFKDRSPSCGLNTPYCERPGGGMGVTAALLQAEGIRIVEIRPDSAFPPQDLADDRELWGGGGAFLQKSMPPVS